MNLIHSQKKVGGVVFSFSKNFAFYFVRLILVRDSKC